MARSPLHEVHAELGARFVDFGGWEMPVQYEGVIAEHQTVRSGAGIFDVTHLGRFGIRGAGTTDVLRGLLCNDATAIAPGRAQYTMALNDAGGVIDDIIIWRFDDERYWVLPNGSNYDRVLERFRRQAPDSVEIEPLREQTVMLAVQGPDAVDVLDAALGVAPGRFRVVEHDVGAMAGTGYTGERGAEVAVARDRAEEVWQRLVAAGAVPAGLGARDTLRLEMGYPLWGNDLDDDTTPLEADLGWVVDWDHEFVGRDALERQRVDGVPKRLVGFVMGGRQIARHGYPLRAGSATGEVSSGNYSPVLERGIGLGYLAPDPGDQFSELEVEIRGRWVPATAAAPPFIDR